MPEARATAALNHPHIATLHEFGPDYLVMEFVEGETLRGPLPLARALLYAGQIPGRAGCCPPQRHCASRSETGERYGIEERSRVARTVGSGLETHVCQGINFGSFSFRMTSDSFLDRVARLSASSDTAELWRLGRPASMVSA